MNNATIRRENVRDYPHYARAQLLANDTEKKKLRANASLPKEAWVGLEDTVFPAMDDTLVVFNDLRDMGLTSGESIFNKAAEWHKQDYSSEATVSMDPDTATKEESNVEYDLDGSPLPVIHSDFSIGWRDDGGNRSGDIETLSADASGRAIGEAAENLVLNGWAPTISGDNALNDGYTMWGLTNHPSVHGGTLGDWTADPAGEIIRTDLQEMARDLKDDEFRPGGAGYNVYIGSDLEDTLASPDEDFDDSWVRDTVEAAVPEINGITVSDYLDPAACLMFRPTRDVVDLAIGLEEQVVQWDGPFRDNFKTIMGFTPRVKDTLRNQCGIAYQTDGTSA